VHGLDKPGSSATVSQFAEAFDGVPEEEIARLPTDLAAQVDHYVYGLPKRPV